MAETIEIRLPTGTNGEPWVTWCAACLAPVTAATGTVVRGQDIPLGPGLWQKTKDRLVYTCWPCGHTGRDSTDGRSLMAAKNMFGFML